MAGDDQRGWWKAFAEITALGLTFPLAIGIGWGAGWWLDAKLGTGPWLKFILTGLGIAAAFVQLFRIAARIERTDRRSRRGDHDRQ
ncbi:MAG TPA: AtpZ/AtpI family protein [Thermoanaerobaculia bacterium]|nr:AtpZ/AtpI family protein [Thermoanaerobaculia bacterium]